MSFGLGGGGGSLWKIGGRQMQNCKTCNARPSVVCHIVVMTRTALDYCRLGFGSLDMMEQSP
jgi:hypothetical protein